MSAIPDVHVVKLGGSLLDLSDLVKRFEAWRRVEMRGHCVLVVGGGAAAEFVRQFDRRHKIGEENGHWLAIQAMGFNAHLVTEVIPRSQFAAQASQCQRIWDDGLLAVMAPVPWLRREECEGVTIPHIWDFTSDSIAAHVAKILGATRLTLLKSTTIELPFKLDQLSQLGVVDPCFSVAAKGIAQIGVVNLRDWIP